MNRMRQNVRETCIEPTGVLFIDAFDLEYDAPTVYCLHFDWYITTICPIDH